MWKDCHWRQRFLDRGGFSTPKAPAHQESLDIQGESKCSRMSKLMLLDRRSSWPPMAAGGLKFPGIFSRVFSILSLIKRSSSSYIATQKRLASTERSLYILLLSSGRLELCCFTSRGGNSYAFPSKLISLHFWAFVSVGKRTAEWHRIKVRAKKKEEEERDKRSVRSPEREAGNPIENDWQTSGCYCNRSFKTKIGEELRDQTKREFHIKIRMTKLIILRK